MKRLLLPILLLSTLSLTAMRKQIKISPKAQFNIALDTIETSLKNQTLIQYQVNELFKGSHIDFSRVLSVVNKNKNAIFSRARNTLAKGGRASPEEIDRSIAELSFVVYGGSQMDPHHAQTLMQQLEQLKRSNIRD